jgi:hypothetical protein
MLWIGFSANTTILFGSLHAVVLMCITVNMLSNGLLCLLQLFGPWISRGGITINIQSHENCYSVIKGDHPLVLQYLFEGILLYCAVCFHSFYLYVL